MSDSEIILALDKDSVRKFDVEGRLHVEVAHISKANVCPYRGEEIPGWKALGLDKQKVYQLLRDPSELKKAAPTCNGIQLLQKHIPVSAEDHQPYDVVGSTGTDAHFDGEYLDNSLHVWVKRAIDAIETGKKRELSCGYRYTADMTPGKFGDMQFDGVMRDIVFNHVALVEDGRAGPDVVVGDSAENLMKKPSKFAGIALRLVGHAVAPVLAQDAKIDLMPIFKDVTTVNFDSKKIAKAIGDACKGKLAKDASMKHVADMLDSLEDMKKQETADESVSDPQHKAMEAAAGGKSTLGIPEKVGKEFSEADKGKSFDAEPLKEFLKGKMSDDDYMAACDMMGGPEDIDGQDGENEEAEEENDIEQPAGGKKPGLDRMKGKDKDMVSKGAMDEALKAQRKAIREEQQAIRVALEDVRPWVGQLPATLAFDSAEAVHRHALKMMKVDNAESLHADALLPVLQVQRKPGSRDANTSFRKPEATLANDAKITTDLISKYAPDIGNISVGV